MQNRLRGVITICLLLGVCVCLTCFAINKQFIYRYSDVAVINTLIEENNLDIPKNAPQKWDFILWSESQPRQIEWMALSTDFNIGIANLSELNGLKSLIWISNKTTALILPANIEELYCADNQLTQLDCSRARKLKILQCSNNQLAELDVSMLKSLEDLECDGNQITQLAIQYLPRLKTISCSNNLIIDLNMKEIPDLQVLYCNDNRLENLNTIELVHLQDLWCDNNQLKYLNTAGMKNLTKLHCSNNQLTELIISDLPKLEYLNCIDNPLQTLKIETLPSLRILECSKEKGSLEIEDAMQITDFDYATRTVEITVQPPDGLVLQSYKGLPEAAIIDNNTVKFTLPHQKVYLAPVLIEK